MVILVIITCYSKIIINYYFLNVNLIVNGEANLLSHYYHIIFSEICLMAEGVHSFTHNIKPNNKTNLTNIYYTHHYQYVAAVQSVTPFWHHY